MSRTHDSDQEFKARTENGGCQHCNSDELKNPALDSSTLDDQGFNASGQLVKTLEAICAQQEKEFANVTGLQNRAATLDGGMESGSPESDGALNDAEQSLKNFSRLDSQRLQLASQQMKPPGPG